MCFIYIHTYVYNYFATTIIIGKVYFEKNHTFQQQKTNDFCTEFKTKVG